MRIPVRPTAFSAAPVHSDCMRSPRMFSGGSYQNSLKIVMPDLRPLEAFLSRFHQHRKFGQRLLRKQPGNSTAANPVASGPLPVGAGGGNAERRGAGTVTAAVRTPRSQSQVFPTLHSILLSSAVQRFHGVPGFLASGPSAVVAGGVIGAWAGCFRDVGGMWAASGNRPDAIGAQGCDDFPAVGLQPCFSEALVSVGEDHRERDVVEAGAVCGSGRRPHRRRSLGGSCFPQPAAAAVPLATRVVHRAR